MTFIDVKERTVSSRKELMAELDVKNIMALPEIEKVSVNVGLGQMRLNKDIVEYVIKTLAAITGQKPQNTCARKAIAGFKLRAGDHVGMHVTLRGKRMYDFLNRLLNITMPRIRDFRGFGDQQYDNQGNLTIGLKDQVMFAELGHDVLDHPFGLSITVTIKNSSPTRSHALLKRLGFPLKTS